MKKRIAILLSLFMTASLLCSCGGTVNMEYNSEGYIEAENGDLYNYAPVGYEPTNQGKEYGLIDGTIPEKVYCIGDIDPGEWITSEYAGAATTVYYSADIELPTLSDMGAGLCYICEQGDKVYSLYTIGDPANGDVDNERAVIKKIIDAISDEQTKSELWPRSSGTIYNLKFYSEEWPAIYYNLLYCRDGGEDYVYDRVSKKCVSVGDAIKGFIYDEDSEG